MKLEPYPSYKPSGVEWLGEVPEHWEVKRLKYSASINDETLPETTDPAFEMVYVDIGSVDAFCGIVDREEVVFEDAPSRARRIVRRGDTIISTVRTYLKAIAPIRAPEPHMIVSTGFAVVRPHRMAPAFMSYALREPGLVDAIVARSVGVSYPAVNASEIGTLPIPLPSDDEQHAIADFLDRETARIDRLVEKKRRLIARLEEKRSALISRTVTQGLPPEVARSADADPHPKLKSSGVEWLGDVPGHWSLKRLKHVAEIRQGITKGRDLAKRKTMELPYLRVANVQDGYVDLSDVATIEILPDELDRYRLRAGDVLMNEGGDNDKLGRGAVWHGEVEPCLHQNHVFSVRPRDPKLSGWIALWTQGTAAKTYFLLHGKQTTNLASISSSNLREMPLLLPPGAEREAVMAFLGRETKRIDTMTAKVDAAIDRLEEYRSALITAAVTGKIDVRGESAGRPTPAPHPEPARLEA